MCHGRPEFTFLILVSLEGSTSLPHPHPECTLICSVIEKNHLPKCRFQLKNDKQGMRKMRKMTQLTVRYVMVALVLLLCTVTTFKPNNRNDLEVLNLIKFMMK